MKMNETTNKSAITSRMHVTVGLAGNVFGPNRFRNKCELFVRCDGCILHISVSDCVLRRSEGIRVASSTHLHNIGIRTSSIAQTHVCEIVIIPMNNGCRFVSVPKPSNNNSQLKAAYTMSA